MTDPSLTRRSIRPTLPVCSPPLATISAGWKPKRVNSTTPLSPTSLIPILPCPNESDAFVRSCCLTVVAAPPLFAGSSGAAAAPNAASGPLSSLDRGPRSRGVRRTGDAFRRRSLHPFPIGRRRACHTGRRRSRFCANRPRLANGSCGRKTVGRGRCANPSSRAARGRRGSPTPGTQPWSRRWTALSSSFGQEINWPPLPSPPFDSRSKKSRASA